MHVVITGGSGFLGLRLAGALLRGGVAGKQIGRLTLVDRNHAAPLDDPRVQQVTGDIADPAFVDRFMAGGVDIVYHLAAVVSSEAEANFDLGMKVNIDASRLLLDACRKAGNAPRVVFTSSVAVFGPDTGALIDERTSVDPQSSYGMEKAVGELLLKDYARRGFIVGAVLRLPTISVRPGLPNRAASSFASGIIREPLSGAASVCPVDPQTALWLMSPRGAIAALVHAGGLDPADLAAHRVINLPGITVTVGEMIDTLEQLGGAEARARVSFVQDDAVERIVASWPRAWDDSAARAMGFAGDADFAGIVQAFIDEDLPAQQNLVRLSA